MISASFNRASNIIAALAGIGMSHGKINNQALIDAVDSLARGIYEREVKLNDEIANQAARQVELGEQNFEVRDEVDEKALDL